MQSSTSLKAACLTAGLVTAWSPLTDQVAQADTVNLAVNLNPSAATTFQNAYVGFSRSDSPDPFILSSLDLSTPAEGSVFNYPAPHPGSVLEKFVTVGLDVDNHVVVSFVNDPSLGPDPAPNVWSDYFPGYAKSDVVSALQGGDPTLLSNFISDLLSRPDNVQTVATTSEDLFFFGSDPNNTNSDPQGAHTFGTISADTDTSDTLPSPVPLPSAFIMGGALLGLVGCGNLLLVRLRRRESLGFG